jgi:hypothetical protein
MGRIEGGVLHKSVYYYNICIFSRDDPFYLLAYWLRHRNTFRAT